MRRFRMMGWAWYLPRCQRCDEQTWYLKASMFSKQMCCEDCIRFEKGLPNYDQVRDEVIQQIFKGTYKFPEINMYR